MKFKVWLNEMGYAGLDAQAPSKAQYATQAAWGLGKAALGAIPVVGNVANAVADIGELANRLWQMRQQGKDVTPLIVKMMHQQDVGGAPANAFDLEDEISNMLSDPAKRTIAKEIVSKIDNLIAQARAGKIPPDAANIIAVNYINRTIRPTYQRLKGR